MFFFMSIMTHCPLSWSTNPYFPQIANPCVEPLTLTFSGVICPRSHTNSGVSSGPLYSCAEATKPETSATASAERILLIIAFINFEYGKVTSLISDRKVSRRLSDRLLSRPPGSIAQNCRGNGFRHGQERDPVQSCYFWAENNAIDAYKLKKNRNQGATALKRAYSECR